MAESVTVLLHRWRAGDEAALAELTPLVYEELRALASQKLRRERAGHTLQPTALLHEAYLRLIDSEVEWQHRAHFYAVASRVMRRVLVDHARARAAQKRGGPQLLVTLGTDVPEPERDLDVVQLHEALERLAAVDTALAEVVELRCFGGLTLDEAAEAMGVNERTVRRHFALARAWLHRELAGGA